MQIEQKYTRQTPQDKFIYSKYNNCELHSIGLSLVNRLIVDTSYSC